MKNKDEEIIESVINAAKKLFMQYGLSKTTMEDIAKAAHKGKSTLYYYFPSKESIFEAVVNAEMHDFFTTMNVSMNQFSSSVDKLRFFAKKKVQELSQKTSFYTLLRGTEYASDFFDKYRLRYDEIEVETMYTIFSEGIEKKELNIPANIDVRLLSELGTSAFRGVELDVIMRNKFKDLEKQIDLFIELFLKSIL